MALQKTPMTPPSTVAAPVPPPVAKAPASKTPPKAPSGSTPFWIGLSLSIGWVCTVMVVMAKGTSGSIAGIPLADLALGVSAAVSPVAMIWMVTAYLQRATDIQTIADPLRRQLTLITGESGAADARIRRFNQAIREQIDLLRNTQTVSQEDLEAIMERMRQHRSDLERFETASTSQVQEIQDVIRHSMLQIERMMDDKFTMLRVLDSKLQQNADGVATQVDGVHGQVTRMLEDIERVSDQMASALERAQRDSQKLADMSRLQESSLTSAAESAAETLGGLTSKIDLSVARFLERASTARDEAERLAGALDAQTRALDDFSSTLPARVSEAEAVLRGVADRLYASEQMAREQAVHLSDKLSQQVDGLQGFMDRFTSRLGEIDSGLDRRHSDLTALSDRIGSTTNEFVSSWEKSLDDLNDRTGNTLLRFTVVNDETRRNAETVAGHLNETTAKYEDVVLRMRQLSNESDAQIKNMTDEIGSQLTQFEALSKASTQAGEEVQQRASVAMQNLQNVLERVLAAREATQAVGETLVKDIYAAVDQSEKMVARLNETAQAGQRSITQAAEALGRQEGDLAGKANASQAILADAARNLQVQAEAASTAMRDQTAQLMNLLAETQSQLATTDVKMQSFASTAVAPVQKAISEIDASTEQGLRTMGRYGEGLGHQVERLQDFNERIGGMGTQMSKTTADAAREFQDLVDRFNSTRSAQDETVRQTLAQFADLSDRLNREVGGLDSQATLAADTLQQAALKIGEQSYQMTESVRNSSSLMKDVTSSLQAEAVQIQELLRRQSEEIGADLLRAEQKFSSLGETIRERADTARSLIDTAAQHYTSVSDGVFSQAEQKFSAVGEIVREKTDAAVINLDRTVAHYNNVTQTTAQELDARARRIDETVTTSQGRIEALQNALARQAEQIDGGAARIETHVAGLTASGDRAAKELATISEKLAATHSAAMSYAQQTLGKIDECTVSFDRQAKSVGEAADKATSAVQKAGAAYGEQAGKLVDNSHQIDSVLRQLTTATSTLAEQAEKVRHSMETQNDRLLTQLGEGIAQMGMTGLQLQEITKTATTGADQAAERFVLMTEAASMAIGNSGDQLKAMADKAQSTLSTLGANVTQQAASLSVIGEQIGEQQRLMAMANESQRAQMVELFDKLRAAHTQASEVAERSIAYLKNSLMDIDNQMGYVGDKSQAAIGNIQKASEGFTQQNATLIKNAQEAEQQARVVLSVTAALRDQAAQLGRALQNESERAGDSLGALLSRLTAGNGEVRSLGENAETLLSTLQKAIGDQTSSLGRSMQEISERQKTLTSALDSQRETINGLLNRLTLAQDETAAAADRAASRLAEGAAIIGEHIEAIDNRAQAAVVTVKQASDSFAKEAAAVDQQARKAEEQAQSIVASAAGLQGHIELLRTSMQDNGTHVNDMLTGLMGRVASGSEELRTIGSSTETVLSSLNRTINNQTGTLTQSMQEISERQEKLTNALDAQRETINGLLNRLTLAQDETANAAERTASSLSDSTQKISGQLDIMNAQAAMTLSNVRESVVDFTDQAAVLSTQGQVAEQQMRSLLGVTSAMADQARVLGSSMKSEADNVATQLKSVIDVLEATGASLKSEGTAAKDMLDSVSQKFASVTETGVAQIGTQAEALSAAVKQSEERMATAGEKIRNQVRGIDEAGDHSLQQAQKLADAAEFASTRLAAMRDTMTDSDKQGQSIIAAASQRIDEVKATLQTELQRLNEFSRNALEQVTGATQGLLVQNESLRANVAASESALTEAARIVREETAQMPITLGRSVSEVETATRTLKVQAAEADQALIGTADRFISVTAGVRNNMADELQRVSGVADEASKTLRQYGQLLAEQVSAMQQSTALLSSEQKDLVEKANLSVNTLAEAGERLSVLRSEASKTAERLASDFDMLDQRAVVSGERLAKVGESISAQANSITEATIRAEKQLGSANVSFREQLERIRSGMQQQIEDINKGLLEITTQLERTGASLRSTTVGAISDVERVGQRFQQTGGEAMAQVDIRTAKMQAATEAVAKMLADFGGHLDGMLSRMAKAGEGIKKQEGDAVSQLQNMLAHLGVVAEKLESSRKMSGDLSVHAIARLDEVVNAVQAHMNSMVAGAQSATGALRGVGQVYNDQTQSLAKGVGEAHSQVLLMNKSIEDMQQRADRMRGALKSQGEDLMKSLRQILTQLELTGDGLSDAVDHALQHQAAEQMRRLRQ